MYYVFPIPPAAKSKSVFVSSIRPSPLNQEFMTTRHVLPAPFRVRTAPPIFSWALSSWHSPPDSCPRDSACKFLPPLYYTMVSPRKIKALLFSLPSRVCSRLLDELLIYSPHCTSSQAALLPSQVFQALFPPPLGRIKVIDPLSNDYARSRRI